MKQEADSGEGVQSMTPDVPEVPPPISFDHLFKYLDRTAIDMCKSVCKQTQEGQHNIMHTAKILEKSIDAKLGLLDPSLKRSQAYWSEITPLFDIPPESSWMLLSDIASGSNKVHMHIPDSVCAGQSASYSSHLALHTLTDRCDATCDRSVPPSSHDS